MLTTYKFNLLILAFLLFIPTILSLFAVIKKPKTREKATRYAIVNAVAGFTITSFIALYFTYLVLFPK